MSLTQWLAARTPPPPPSLAERLRQRILEYEATVSVRPDLPADAYVDAAEQLLRQLLRDGCMSRESAPDLLAADALVTYAFEAACDEPELIEQRAELAMARISRLAAERNS